MWRKGETRSNPPPGRLVDPIIIQISNDAGVSPKLPLGKPTRPPHRPLPVSFRLMADVTTPLIAFFDTRDGLGQRATDVLRMRLAYLSKDGGNDARYFHFQIGDPKVPMSWLLSDYAGRLIDAQLPLPSERKGLFPCIAHDPRTRPGCNVNEFWK